MTEEQPQSNEALERIRQWRQDFKANLVPSPLEDLTQLSAKLDLSRANPNAIARLFSKGSETLHEMFKEAGTLRAMARRLERVLDDQGAKRRMSGVAELSLVVGVAMWHGNQMPVLLYPVDVRRDEKHVSDESPRSRP